MSKTNKKLALDDLNEAFNTMFPDMTNEDETLMEEGQERVHAEIPESWTIVNALNYVVLEVMGTKLSEDFWKRCEPAFDFLTERLSMTKWQVLFISIMSEKGSSMSWADFAKYVGCTRLSLIGEAEAMEELKKRKWVSSCQYRDCDGFTDSFYLEDGVVKALSHNEVFVPEDLEGMDEQTFMEKLRFKLNKCETATPLEAEKALDWMLDACEANPQLPYCEHVLTTYKTREERMILLILAGDYAGYGDTEDEGVKIDMLDRLIDEDFTYDHIRQMLLDGTHLMIRSGLLEPKCEDGMALNDHFILTKGAKTKLFPVFKPSSRNTPQSYLSRHMKSHSAIQAKDLFYNDTEQEQINRLADLLSEEKLAAIRSRLEEKGMRKGFSCLFYGLPGTGKTETVLQLARLTGRDVMEVNIAGMRDKYVGESEKNIKSVFVRYRKACEQSAVMPILLFNEADALINKRTENIEHSVDKMDNAMQNIILQEMENLDGILIATTNLTCNLDNAFDRRFLFKVEFQKPSVAVKTKIWRSMMEGLSQEEAQRLAAKYDFSGGQIENIARKQNIEYILSGEKASLDRLERFCNEELISKRNTHNAIGFK